MQYGKTHEGNIKMNVVYVSVAFKETNGNYGASEIPGFFQKLNISNLFSFYFG